MFFSRKYLSIFFLSNAIFAISVLQSCDGNGGGGPDVVIPDFNYPTSVVFEDSLSAYNIFQGNPQDLVPADDFHPMELSSVLFTDYAQKQRLVKVPEGTQMSRNANGTINFPDGTILAKTFYYFDDERDPSLGKRVIETRLMIKNDGIWNVATYLWDDAQAEGILELGGFDTQVNWITEAGVSRSTMYHVPDENECIACHQSNDSAIPLGTTLRNLNRFVDRNNASLNQLEHLQTVGIFSSFDVAQVEQMVDYNNTSASLEDRARAYFHMNCAHCHNPNAWEEPAGQDLDLRYETPLNQTGIAEEAEDIEAFVVDGEMPFIGTTVLDDEGVDLVIQFINSL